MFERKLAAVKEIAFFVRPQRILFLLCAGSYATNLAMVLIGPDGPPNEAGFLFLALKVSVLPRTEGQQGRAIA
ncbi:hypothetical protein NKI19_06235 [Mesorhizobium sp. M0751]|uniref:hypothetical protein n=1 Tax=unclassified Mesorhizobium TaxID=325217 RepID=UPI003338893A